MYPHDPGVRLAEQLAAPQVDLFMRLTENEHKLKIGKKTACCSSSGVGAVPEVRCSK